MPTGLNTTHIMLTSKKNIPQRIGDLCPISICNIIYMILVAKMLAIRVPSSQGDS